MELLAAMRIFQRVANTLSFTEAGELLGLAPSSVSRQVDALEKHLGVRLLTRTTRRMSLTEPGEVYKTQLDGLLADIDAVHEGLSGFAQKPRGRLKVSSPPVLGKRLLSPHLPAFLRAYPEVTLELSLSDGFVDLVDTDTDLAIRLGALGDSSLVSRPLGRDRRVICCHPDYLAGAEPPARPSELASHNCLRYRRSGERTVWRFGRPGGEGTVEFMPEGDLVANDIEVLYAAALAGCGIALLPYWLVSADLQRGELLALLPDYPLASTLQATGIHFVYALNRRQSLKVHAFMDHVIGTVGPLLV